MISLTDAVEQYLVLRRGLGFKLRDYEPCLSRFAEFLDRRGAQCITSALAVEFVFSQTQSRGMAALYLIYIRGFARYRRCDDPATEVPDGRLLPYRAKRFCPHIYSSADLDKLYRETLAMKSPNAIKGRTYCCLFGLLAVTGLRLGEALNLTPTDFDSARHLITVRHTKFDKTRLVPLHRSTCKALRRFSADRDAVFRRKGEKARFFFPTVHGGRLGASVVGKNFREITCKIGIRPAQSKTGPRLHDFRHCFAIRTISLWYECGQDVNRLLPRLSTYLGHSGVAGTYWYLSSTPELRAAACRLMDDRWKGEADE